MRYEVGETNAHTDVGESLAPARLCRGEARLARRIDIENNLNTCAAHTAGRGGFVITLDHWRANQVSPLR